MAAPELEPDFAETRLRTVSLPTTSAAPWLARQLLGQWCREWDLAGPVVDEVTVVVSELVTECVATGGSGGSDAAVVEVRASLGPDELEVAVSAPLGSSAAASSATMAAGADDEGSRRMDIVRGLSSSVEVRARAQERTVVVVMPLRQAPWSTGST